MKHSFFRFVVPFILFVVPAALWLRHFFAVRFSQNAELRPGSEAPAFSLRDLSGNPHTLNEYLEKNEYVMLHFWATWCPTCNEEMPTVVARYPELKSQGAQIVAISIDQDAADLRNYLAGHALPFPVILDANNKVMDRYGISYIPTTILLDKNGRILARNTDISKLDLPVTKATP